METKNIRTSRFENIQYTVSGEGYAVVLIHGFPLDGTIWNEVVDKLSKKYKVIVPDMPGSGGSISRETDLTVEDMAESVRSVLDNEGVSSAVLAGHSMGGYVALAFADLYPSMLKGLVMLHSSAQADSEEKKAQRRKVIELIEKGGKEPFVKQMVPNLFSGSDGKKSYLEGTLETALRTPPGSLVAFYNAMINRPDRTGKLSNNDLAVAWVIGEDDSIIPKSSLIQQTTLTNVNFVYVYKNCGHMSMMEQPDMLMKDLDEFLIYCYDARN
ncbi:MAG: alpha/beta hydrolase [Chitinophagales bacterium]|nr:alpha/beta hydrolase [Chitinophagaceae bacterium]MCB9064207.1 alpha/beta hydrolase [Chitinophagales bacterium]